jgi:hypothetical protein
VDCSPAQFNKDIPCEIFILKNDKLLDQWDAGARDPSLFYTPPSNMNVTTQTIQQNWLVPTNGSYVLFIINNNFNSPGSVKMVYNYRWDDASKPYDPTILLIVLACAFVLCCCIILCISIGILICILRRIPKEYEPVDTEVRIF